MAKSSLPRTFLRACAVAAGLLAMPVVLVVYFLVQNGREIALKDQQKALYHYVVHVDGAILRDDYDEPLLFDTKEAAEQFERENK